MARILVVDDDFETRAIIEKMLLSAGHEVICAANGLEALQLCRAESADLVLTDLFMPEVDGIEAIQAIRREFPNVKIIAMSGNPTATSMLSVARRLGTIATLQKPFTEAELVTVLKEVLR